ncbi:MULTISPECIES: RNA methyltransferase [Acidithrix]|uniref:Putative TrmH family tRNA/rRNA methyltransferase n=1 Tax=Acidithrix ferrooxidans TaxID=1280514 RepID=A0A0D8HFL7_9ACTN|nr:MULTISPECIES: RNA methyltransferase [Acidithrix]KJF16587.1 putative TrmH family tRNA/rRNA methyltransferase [Acidithrix ferrooxidans]CAG4931009.1 unnamed protein product [Acidithrix sp. C25]
MRLSGRSERIKRLRKLVSKASFRLSERAFVLEGPNCLEAALRSGIDLEGVYYSCDLNQSHFPLITDSFERGISVFEVESGLLEAILDLSNAQPVVAVAPMETRRTPSSSTTLPILVLDEIRDPGNAGTIIRSAHASGIREIVFLPGCVDPYNPKVVRSSVGSIFFVDVTVAVDKDDTLAEISNRGYEIYGTSLGSQLSYVDAQLSANVAIVIGNEAFGITKEVEDRCDKMVRIPTAPSLESLNASMAATLLLFESARQRGFVGLI